MAKRKESASSLPYDRFTQYFRYRAVDVLGDNSIVYTSDINGQFNIWTQSYYRNFVPGYQRMLTAFHDRTVREFAVSPDGKTIYFMADRDGNEQYQLYRIASSGGTCPYYFGRNGDAHAQQGLSTSAGDSAGIL